MWASVCVAGNHHARACRSVLDRCTAAAHECDGLLTLHGTRQHVPGRLATLSHFAPQLKRTTPDTRAALLAVGLCVSPATTTREPAARCSIDALRLRTSEMGCSRYMAPDSTCQGA